MGDQLDLTGLFSWPSNLPKSYFSPFYSHLRFSLGRGPRPSLPPALVNSGFPRDSLGVLS
jgi:hypothetical protein